MQDELVAKGIAFSTNRKYTLKELSELAIAHNVELKETIPKIKQG